MKDFKDTTKTRWVKGYAQGGSVRGAAQVSKTMREFKKGPEEEKVARKAIGRMSPEDVAKKDAKPLDRLKRMRGEKPTGGALGQVSAREAAMLRGVRNGGGGALGHLSEREAAMLKAARNGGGGALGNMTKREAAAAKNNGKYGSFNRKPLIGN